MADRGEGRPLSTAKIAKLLMIDDSEVNRIVSKFKAQFSDLVSQNNPINYPVATRRLFDEE